MHVLAKGLAISFPTLYLRTNLLRLKQKRKGKIYPFECRVPKKARRDKKAILSDQYREIAENNIVGKTRDLFEKIRNTKGTFHAKMGTIKNRNGMDLNVFLISSPF